MTHSARNQSPMRNRMISNILRIDFPVSPGMSNLSKRVSLNVFGFFMGSIFSAGIISFLMTIFLFRRNIIYIFSIYNPDVISSIFCMSLSDISLLETAFAQSFICSGLLAPISTLATLFLCKSQRIAI